MGNDRNENIGIDIEVRLGRKRYVLNPQGLDRETIESIIRQLSRAAEMAGLTTHPGAEVKLGAKLAELEAKPDLRFEEVQAFVDECMEELAAKIDVGSERI